MSLSDVQVRQMARLTFEQPYTMQQLAKSINSTYREVYDFFRTSKGRESFNIAKRPWVEVLDNADPKISQGKRTNYKKWVRDCNVWIRLAPAGFYLITARAKVKPTETGQQAAQNRQQARREKKQAEKEVFRKLNYPQLILDALAAGDLEPADLPDRAHPGSSKYRDLVPDRRERSEVDRLFEDFWPKDEQAPLESALLSPELSGTQDIQEAEDLPAGWTRAGRMYRETIPTAGAGAFGADGIPEEGEPLNMPFAFDFMLQEFERDMRKKHDPFKLGKCGHERFEAVMKMLRGNIKNFGFTIDEKGSNGKRKFIPNNQDIWDECVELFEQYLERTEGERLVLMPKADPWGEPILKQNANRFNNEDKRMEARIRFENIFNDAARTYKSAIMLTLTSGQWHDNIFDDVKLFQENWNKLITRLRKEARDKRVNALMKDKPEYLKVKVSKNLLSMPSRKMAAYEFSSDVLTPHAEKGTAPFFEALNSYQTRTRVQRRHEGIQGREESDEAYFVRVYGFIPGVAFSDESDAAYFEKYKNWQQRHNRKAQALRQAAREFAETDLSLKMPYLCVREFQRNGNMHYHVIIFGISWLKKNDEISRIWQQYGQGKITRINKIRFDDERGYIWNGNAPEDSSGRQPMEYLKKYLLKGQYANKNPGAALLYWIFNSRFFTYSSSLLSDEHRPRPYVSKGIYEYAGVLSADNILFSMGCFVVSGGSPPLGSANESSFGKAACT